ncbi:MAG TPA: aminotransferase class IV [Streptosporangiaceae bacterium]|nr:aminotransferase class IV [Streptosporangiaceae bacterium]
MYFADRWVTRDEAKVSIDSLAMRYAISVFEGIRIYSQIDRTLSPRPFLLDEHIERLRNSLALMRLPDPGVDRLPALIEELIHRNDIHEDAYVRVAVTAANAGDLGTEALPALTVTATPMGRKRWLARSEAMSLTISDWRRAPTSVFPPAAKNISNYAGPRLAWLAAREAGFDGCVLTNHAGRLCEAPTAALFLVRDGVLLTPHLSEDVLPSITRAWILRTAEEHGIPARETGLTRADAGEADEAFLCGTGIEIAPVRAFDGRACRDWPDSPLTRTLIIAYFVAARGAGSFRALGDLSPIRRDELINGPISTSAETQVAK